MLAGSIAVAGRIFSRKRADAWRLRGWDLPPAWVVARESRLEGIEDNVVFRSMMFGRRTGRSMPRTESTVGVVLILVLSLVLLSCFGPLFILIAFPLYRYFRKPQTQVIGFFGFPEILLRELVETRVPARDWTIALWGLSVSYRRGYIGGGAAAVGILAIWAFAGFAVPRPQSELQALAFASLLLLGGFACGAGLGAYALRPHALLPALQGRVRRFRRSTEISHNPLGWLYSIALVIGVLIAGGVLVTVASVLGIGLGRSFPVFSNLATGLMDEFRVRPWFTPAVLILAGAAGGAVFSFRRGERARTEIEARLAKLDAEIEKILLILRATFDYGGETPPRVPRATDRPSGDLPQPQRPPR